MIGKTISHYRILDELGAGGMGVVYRARDEQLKRDVALKVVSPRFLSDETARSRFRREALSLSQLNHPNICLIHEIGEANGQTFIVMEYIEGRLLSDRIPGGGLPTEATLSYGTQIADALAHAHKHGLTHRDIKSSNVMITNEDRVKLLDFGLAKRLESSGPDDVTLTSEELTQEGATVGTPAYMAPEVLRGQQADERSDIWALGVVLHEMITESRPFQGSSVHALTAAILREPAAPLPEDTPAGLRRIVSKCLAKEPDLRYQSAVEVSAALEAASLTVPAPAASKSSAYRWLALAAAAVAIPAVWFGPWLKRSPGRPGQILSIAVLPFENRSSNADQEYFADGMTEQLITDLSKLRAIRVTSRTSIMRYRGTKKLLSEIASELGVDAVVSGSVMLSADQVRIAAQLIEARGDRNLWAESYDRKLGDVLALQREVARSVANEIRITMTPAEQAQLASDKRVDPEVHQLILRGQYFANKGSEAELRQALGYFEQAVAKDPSYGPAHAASAYAYRSLATVHAPPREVMPKAKAAAVRALQLDETLAEAHVSLAFVLLSYDWDWPEAEKHLRRAVELNPSSAEAHLLYGRYFAAQGQPAESLAEIRLAQKLDPLSVLVQVNLMFSLMAARRFDEAIEQSRRVTEREPNLSWAYVVQGLAHAEKGEFKQALRAIGQARKLDDSFGVKAMESHVVAAAGDRRKAEQLLVELKAMGRKRYVCAYEIAHTYVKLGDKKQALEWLEQGKRDRADCMIWLLSEPWMDPLRGEPQYRELIEHIGLGTGMAGAKP